MAQGPQVISIDDARAPEVAARAIAAGDVIAFPTDTVYGLGADVWQPEAMRRLYALKGRPDEKALPILLADEEQWSLVAAEAREAARRLMRAFWPGALTIVLPRRPEVPDAVGPLAQTIAMRVPDHDGLRRVLERTGPLASSSANRSGEAPASRARDVVEALGGGVGVLLDGGALPARPASTVVDLTGPHPVILRQGAVTAEQIGALL